MPVIKPPDTSRLNESELGLAISIPKLLLDPIPPLRFDGRPVGVATVELYFEGCPSLSAKGVQLAITFQRNRAGQIRHRFYDAARNQNIALFHFEGNHTDSLGNWVPHIVRFSETGSKKRGTWPGTNEFDLDGSIQAVFSFLKIEHRPQGLEKWNRP